MYEARCCEASDMAESKAEILLEILPPFPPPPFFFVRYSSGRNYLSPVCVNRDRVYKLSEL